MSLRQRLPFAAPNAPVLVGFSGGLDSTVLLHALAADPAVRARGLRALHVDHGLQAASGAWSRACGEACAALGIELVVRKVQVVAAGDGPEAAARIARRAAFAAELRAGEWLALAHHRDDQAETVLLRLLRGAGSQGLAGMRATVPFAAGTLWRPLLDVPRADLLAAAHAAGLRWQDDPSNTDAAFDRNYLRLHVLPALAARWPQASASLAHSAALLAADADALANETAIRLASLQGLDPHRLSRPRLRALAPAWRARVLRAWVASLGLPPLPAHLVEVIESELLPARDDAQAEVAWAGARMRAWCDDVHADLARAPLSDTWEATWDGTGPIALPNGASLVCLDTAGGDDVPEAIRAFAPMRLAARRGGERIRLPGRGHSHAVKKQLQALGVPPWEREQLPFVHAADGELLAVGDVLVSARLASAGARFALVQS